MDGIFARVVVEIGPMLERVLGAQRQDERELAWPQLMGHASEVAELCRLLDFPLVWPAGSAADRLAGAAIVASEGRVRVRGWSGGVAGRVLLLTVTSLTAIPLADAARHARACGAVEVHACGVHVDGLDADAMTGVLDSYHCLGAPPSQGGIAGARRLSTLAS